MMYEYVEFIYTARRILLDFFGLLAFFNFHMQQLLVLFLLLFVLFFSLKLSIVLLII